MIAHAFEFSSNTRGSALENGWCSGKSTGSDGIGGCMRIHEIFWSLSLALVLLFLIRPAIKQTWPLVTRILTYYVAPPVVFVLLGLYYVALGENLPDTIAKAMFCWAHDFKACGASAPRHAGVPPTPQPTTAAGPSSPHRPSCRQFDLRAISQVVGREVIGIVGGEECRVEFGKVPDARNLLVISYKGLISTPEEIERWFAEFPCPASFEKRAIANLGQDAQLCTSNPNLEAQTNARVMHLVVRQGMRSIWVRATQTRQPGEAFERVDLETTLRVMARQVLDAG